MTETEKVQKKKEEFLKAFEKTFRSNKTLREKDRFLDSMIYWMPKFTDDWDWDWAYMYEIHKHKLLAMIEYMKGSQIAVGWENDVKRMELCTRLIDIIVSEGDSNEETYVNVKNASSKYKQTYKKYMMSGNSRSFNYLLENIRTEKALRIYCKMLEYFSQTWWD